MCQARSNVNGLPFLVDEPQQCAQLHQSGILYGPKQCVALGSCADLFAANPLFNPCVFGGPVAEQALNRHDCCAAVGQCGRCMAASRAQGAGCADLTNGNVGGGATRRAAIGSMFR